MGGIGSGVDLGIRSGELAHLHHEPHPGPPCFHSAWAEEQESEGSAPSRPASSARREGQGHTPSMERATLIPRLVFCTSWSRCP